MVSTGTVCIPERNGTGLDRLRNRADELQVEQSSPANGPGSARLGYCGERNLGRALVVSSVAAASRLYPGFCGQESESEPQPERRSEELVRREAAGREKRGDHGTRGRNPKKKLRTPESSTRGD